MNESEPSDKIAAHQPSGNDGESCVMPVASR